MFTSAKVTREHREAAHLALYGRPRDMRPGAPGDGSAVSRWIETGEPLGKHSCHQAVAQAIADAEARGEQRGRAAERAAIDAWMRDRDAQRERNAEDIFEAAYAKAPNGAGYSEAVHRGVVELAVAIGAGAHTGEAAERHRRDDFQEGIACGREMERSTVVAWLRVTPRAGGRTVSIDSSQDIARLADAIERGDHVPPGTPPADEPTG